jgi:hypothetical protein
MMFDEVARHEQYKEGYLETACISFMFAVPRSKKFGSVLFLKGF